MSDAGFDRSMSDAEGLMWRLEKDPYLTSTFGSITILDRPPDFDAFRRRMNRASKLIPGLRQRVMSSPANLTPPIWVDDPDFSIDRHVRRIACPKPGKLRQVMDLATLLVADPFDRNRPLWQFTVIEGMRGGKAAIVQKMHHTITDGERGVELSLQYLDFDRDAPEPPPVAEAERIDLPGDPHDSDPLRNFVAGGLRLPLSVVKQVRDLLTDPASIPDASSAAAGTLRGIAHQLSDTEQARSPLWTERSLERHLEVVRAPFRETKDAARRLGGTLNTAFLTAAAHAAADYHHRIGVPAESLRASMAISTRTESSGANAFSLARIIVPTTPMPISERFVLVGEAVDDARASSARGGLDALATLTAALPTSMLTRMARQQSETVDFATSNVRGSPRPMYIAGSKMEAIYPLGPLGGVAFNLTLMSYLGSLDMGIHIDPAAVADPAMLAECLDDAFRELIDT